MITQSELAKIIQMPDAALRQHLHGWGVVHCLELIGDLQRAMKEFSKKCPYEKNILREGFISLQRKIEMWAYERFVMVKKKELYRKDPSFISRRMALKIEIKKEWESLYREHSY